MKKDRKKAKRKRMSKVLRIRFWKYRILSGITILLAIRAFMVDYESKVMIVIGTLLLIIGVALWNMASPDDYNATTDAAVMIGMDKPRKIREFYEVYRNISTPLGSGWLGKIIGINQEALIFGPDHSGQYLYFRLSRDGNIGYLSFSPMVEMIEEQITSPEIPAKQEFGDNTAQYLCYHSDLLLLQSQLKESIETFVETGQINPIRQSKPSEVYTFDENFKLIGQHFRLSDENGKMIYEVDGTAPLKTLYVYDRNHNEIFRLTKELVHMLPTYRFFYRGELYGILKKKFTFVRDQFSMEVTEGELELREYAGLIGRNFSVTLNGKMLGAIMDNLSLNMNNIVFDNSVVIAYERQYLPLLTAMAVMVARELARDED